MDCKVYVDVTATFSRDGILMPVSIRWEDGREYKITRVIDVRRMASTKAGGVGERYLCVIDNSRVSLYYEGENRWFMERANYDKS